MVSRLFRRHGDLCASHPWEVIVATLTAAACALAVEREPEVPMGSRMPCGGWADKCPGLEAEYHAADAVVMTIVRCLAILYSYYQFRNLSKFGSKNILAIAGMFAMVSSVVFTSSVINFLRGDMSDLKDALFFFLLLIDVSKASLLARLALAAGSGHEVRESIARGMELLGPPLTLDTLVEALLVGVGVLSGVPRLVALSWYACMSVVVNYVIFMTLYPACLSLVSELSNGSRIGDAPGAGLLRALHAAEEEQKPNPVVQRVKLIMSAGLLLVHLHSRWSVKDEVEHGVRGTSISPQHNILNQTEETGFPPFMKLLTVSVEHLVILILVCALAAKFIFFEDREELNSHLHISNTKKEEENKEESTTMLAREPSIKHITSMTNLSINEQVKAKKPIFDLSDSDTEDKETQTDEVVAIVQKKTSVDNLPRLPRSEAECLEIYKSELGAQGLSDNEVIMLVNKGHIPLYKLEGALGDPLRGVKLRRDIIAQLSGFNTSLDGLAYLHYDYSKVLNACCENVIGYVGIPVGFAGPLIVDGVSYMVPMATTEGALVASTNRGAKALGPRGVTSIVEDIGMTRAPVVSFPNVTRACEARRWIETKENYEKIKEAFDATSRFARLQEIHIAMDGPQLYIRFRATTGDAMGMNMVSKGAEMALRCLHVIFPDMTIISLSGNYCSDKKPAAINWLKGRGKRVVCEAVIDGETLRKVFKTDAKTLTRCNKLKNLSGSALAGTIGGNNAHAANMVTAIFIATGQDPAQNVTSSNCSTNMEPTGDDGEDLYMTCTMPSLEVGTIGGGTILPGQSACLDLLGVRGAHPTCPAQNSKQLARIICATVLAGELSLMAALVNSDLVRSHMRHNRSSAAINVGSSPMRVPTPTHRKISPSSNTLHISSPHT